MESIELFSGTGGLALGLQMSGFHHTDLYEWNEASCNNIRYNIKNGYPDIQDWNIIQSDVRTVHYDGYTGNIQLVAGGPPCQPFSLGGKHQAYNDQRDMFPEAVRAIREIQPKAFIFENVRGLLRKSFQSYFNYILLQLQHPEVIKPSDATWQEHLAMLERYHTSNHDLGLSYHVVFRLLNAADYGVPQMRHRVIIVGFRSDYNADWSFPEPTHSQDALLYSKWISKDYWKKHNIPTPNDIPISAVKLRAVERNIKENTVPSNPWQTVRDAIHDLPEPLTDSSSSHFHNHVFRPGAKIYAGHSGSLLDEPSKTIKAGAHGVPGGENTIVLDDGSVRYYTVRESARIQTFPDEYIFSSSWTESMRQIGNAVPVRLAHIVGSSIFNKMERMIKDAS
ncbi:MAG: DNA cytosine methyltransferase [Selenomonas sp.]|nr:DNA cytosine methyltransferase [Selenomonas sp.]